MLERNMRARLLGVVAMATNYCMQIENASEAESAEFVANMLGILPRLYLEFFEITPAVLSAASEADDDSKGVAADGDYDENMDPFGLIDLGEEGEAYYGSYVDEDYYESVRRHLETLLGPDDTFLETFEEDMKYSDTPIAASVSESLADIFQPLYNFISIVKDTGGDELEGAYRQCHEDFVAYWSQTLCNVLRALNHIHFSPSGS